MIMPASGVAYLDDAIYKAIDYCYLEFPGMTYDEVIWVLLGHIHQEMGVMMESDRRERENVGEGEDD